MTARHGHLVGKSLAVCFTHVRTGGDPAGVVAVSRRGLDAAR